MAVASLSKHLSKQPLSDERCLLQVPACYLHNPPRLQPGYFAKFQQDTLFYIFYSMPGDEAQLLAADELSARQWWFHKVRDSRECTCESAVSKASRTGRAPTVRPVLLCTSIG